MVDIDLFDRHVHIIIITHIVHRNEKCSKGELQVSEKRYEAYYSNNMRFIKLSDSGCYYFFLDI